MDEVSETNGANEADEVSKTNKTSDTNKVIESNDNEQVSGTNLVMASRWKRLFGAIIDSVISGIIGFTFMIKMGIYKRLLEGIQMTTNERIYLALIGFGAFLIIHGYLLFKRGQTVGKILVGTKIVDSNGNVPNFGNG